jgi:chemotaxis protein histidine kinase CheA
MSDEFLNVARQEIQTEIDSLKQVFAKCSNDEQLYNKSKDIQSHIHKIKGLAPMMGQDKVGEIARISDIILKHVINHGILKSSQGIILEAVQRMDGLFNEKETDEIDNFRKKTINTYPDITGF